MSLRLELYRKKQKLKRYLERSREGSCTVLLYHRVANAAYDPQQLCVSPGAFEKQLRHLKRKYHFITVEEFNNTLKSRKPFHKKALLLNFDDGYADNLLNALPILESEGLQAVFYIATANLDTQALFWWDELDEIFRQKETFDKETVNALLKKQAQPGLNQLYAFFLDAMKRAPGLEARNSLLQQARQLGKAGGDLSAYRCMRFEELKTFSASKSVVIGGHTVNHLSLGHLSSAAQESEISASVKILQDLLQKPVTLFSYPYGEKQDYNADTLRICRELGLEHGAANYGGYVRPGDDLFSFTRFVVRNDAPELLHRKLKAIL